ncbi:methionyl-tRNA synthetase [Desulfobaculum xiamenense]|uniref:Methionine--tRNA ligase n=1 Tax=Desulfobaculum xiamenense TaxID=995050 RepID=A0A846QQW7_9BACT|nr:methionine--tRNA ligase [Desulfobaculum xiamenense]NJB68882.1 methionyl-tRNA synthetase [Desulfobaculum xiamenense]
MSRFFISTPIYYVNAKPHLGHAYSTIVADSIARFHRIMGDETFFLTGTDEHGDKIAQAAEAAGTSPREFVDEISGTFRNLWPRLNVSNNDFIRTTEQRHIDTVREVLQKVYDSGDIYQSEYEGLYCYGCEQFLTEKDLVDGKCPDHDKEPSVIREKNYFFRMSKYQDWLRQYIIDNPDFIRPERYRNEVLSMLEMGVLDDLCISRPKSRLSWGIELPFDPDYVTYVWFDALLNYITALGGPEGEDFGKFWPGANHLIAKDILKPHAIFWPTMLKAAGFEPYQHLNVHGYWLVKDTKMSKSIGNVVDPLSMVDTYGLDAFRYFLLREMRFGRDASFSETALVGRLNADLANDLGNLFSRVLSMTHKYFGGVVPTPSRRHESVDVEMLNLASNSFTNFQHLFGNFEFGRGLEALWELVRGLNKYVDATQPWALFKAGDTERLGDVMYVLLMLMRKVALHVWPVMPATAETMLAQLGQGESFDPASVELPAEAESFGRLEPGTALAKGSNLFPRVELKAEGEAKPAEAPKPAKKAEAKAEPKASKEKPVTPEVPEAIDFADFQKVDLRAGVVLSCERHPDADRLLVVRVDLGEAEPRQIVAGLAEFFKPEEMVGRQVVVVANLAPRKLRGLMSQGMILAVRKEGGLELLTVSGPVPGGSKVS